MLARDGAAELVTLGFPAAALDTGALRQGLCHACVAEQGEDAAMGFFGSTLLSPAFAAPQGHIQVMLTEEAVLGSSNKRLLLTRAKPCSSSF